MALCLIIATHCFVFIGILSSYLVANPINIYCKINAIVVMVLVAAIMIVNLIV